MSSHEESETENDLDRLVQEHIESANENENRLSDEAEEAPSRKEVKAKRIVKNPQPKLNVDTLKGPRGIHTLPKTFENIKFQGKNHEEQDLNLLMKTYEYWCHRLFPKFSFDDCLARIEGLGHKKPLQTHLKKIRMDMLQEESQASDKEEEALIDDYSDEATPFDDPVQLTEEQMERIRLNREKALKKLQNVKNIAEETNKENVVASENSGGKEHNDVDRNKDFEQKFDSTTNQLDNQDSRDVANNGNSQTADRNETVEETYDQQFDNYNHEAKSSIDKETDYISQNDKDDEQEEEMDIESMLDVIRKDS